MEKTNESLKCSMRWGIDKFSDRDGAVYKALRAGMSVKDAMLAFPGAFIKSERFSGGSFSVLRSSSQKRRVFNKNLRRGSVQRRVALNEGLGELIDVICGLGTPTKWDEANARLGVGDSSTAEAATQTGLLAATNKTYKAMDANYPQRAGQTVEWRATFGSGDANYAWEEYTVVNAADDTGKNLNRKVASKGTKSSGESWTLSLQISFS